MSRLAKAVKHVDNSIIELKDYWVNNKIKRGTPVYWKFAGNIQKQKLSNIKSKLFIKYGDGKGEERIIVTTTNGVSFHEHCIESFNVKNGIIFRNDIKFEELLEID